VSGEKCGGFGTMDLACRVAGTSSPVSGVRLPLADTLEVATLVFDSSQAPLTAGIRGATARPRQLLYKSGSLCIDMRMQPKPGTDSMVLIGQLLDSAQPTLGISDVPVSLVCEGDTVARKRTNTFGEFDFGFESLHHSQLIFGIGKRRTIVVPVPEAQVEAA
jgi:hypothetical protein